MKNIPGILYEQYFNICAICSHFTNSIVGTKEDFPAFIMVDIHDELKVLQEINPLMTELCFSLIFYTYLRWISIVYRLILRGAHRNHYASPSSGEAYRDRRLTTNFEL